MYKKKTRWHKIDKQIYTSLVQRHKVNSWVVPFGGKKGTSLVRKGTSKAKKEQAKQKRNKLGEKDTGLEKKIQVRQKNTGWEKKRYRLGKKKDTGCGRKKIQG